MSNFFFPLDWFKEASVFLEAYQRERLRRQEEKEAELKDPIKEKLKPELKKLKDLGEEYVSIIIVTRVTVHVLLTMCG